MNDRFKQIQNEPYRLFFPLGILLALGGVGHWLFYALGWMSRYDGFQHANIQVQLYLPCFVGGFLMTAVPRFSATWPARTWELTSSLAVLAGIAAALFSGQWLISESLYAVWLILLVRFIAVRFLKRQVQYPPVEFIWIPAAVFLGLVGTGIIIFVLADRMAPGWMMIGRSMQEQGFMLALVLGVGCFLGPRLMGIYQMPAANPQNFQAQIRKKVLIHAFFAAFLALSFFLEGPQGNLKGYTLRAVVVTGMFFWTRSLNTTLISGPSLFIRLLSASYWMIAAGYWLIPFFPKLLITLLHLVFLGGFSLMITCVSTMVVLNHAGRGELLHKPLWIFWLVTAGLTVALGLRLVAPFFGQQYFFLIGIASSVWLTVGIGWLFFSMPFILSAPGKHEPESDHQKMVQGTGHAC